MKHRKVGHRRNAGAVVRHKWTGPRHRAVDPTRNARWLATASCTLMFGVILGGVQLAAYAESDAGWRAMATASPDAGMIDLWHVGIVGIVAACVAPLLMLMAGVGIKERKGAHA